MKPFDAVKRFRIEDGKDFRLSSIDPGDTLGLDIDKDDAKEMLAAGIKRLRKLQERLYAEGKWSLLIVLQAMDAAGKDSAIEHVMSGINPQGCDVRSFKAPSPAELRHDFLWRTTRALPERGRIGIFNRSYYEEVLVVRVHKNLLAAQMLPPGLVHDEIWQERFEDIRTFENHLARSGTVVLKFFLHVSKEEQKKRFLDRIEDPDKHWKFNAGDVAEREHWDDYMNAYEDMIRHTATETTPWHVVPADSKWFSRLVIATAIVEKLEAIDPKFPEMDAAAIRAMQDARETLTAGKKSSKT
ncbi:polyphosphate kinase 2 family protein [Mesorhizobium sp. LHD-90]|uniref:polyphosphate kinase 2 family protein n=1 Tax=Mesorhizobium sp. LHD-90 TaxID=3071414 RepID=UPI0027E1B9EB|nr:polyphosphate kinase 2 family protein [Mesorhizobium sp. LHD-90]MDQ6436588.1 polyphosphate kinase 2 family protein [Mesorhizobium sp. LHD-90]